MSSSTLPYIEKYRPTALHDVILDPLNRRLLESILSTKRFPHLLLYGPPGTGKTTIIMNLIHEYNKTNTTINTQTILQLNASDERGIDTIRSQIALFVQTNPLFSQGMKFVVLDEVDYMTKQAQQGLRCILQEYADHHVRFCLMCNYISKIDPLLQHEFVIMRLNQLPIPYIVHFLQSIVEKENLPITLSTIQQIQSIHGSDIRSMLNYIQLHGHNTSTMPILQDGEWDLLFNLMQTQPKQQTQQIISHIKSLCTTYSCSEKELIRRFCSYLLRSHIHSITSAWLSTMEDLVHANTTAMSSNTYIGYAVQELTKHTQEMVRM